MRHFVSFVMVGVICLVWTSIMPGIDASPLAGTYLQLTSEHGQWESAKWSELFTHFQKLGLSKLIIQWTVYDKTAFYPCTGRRQVPHPPLEIILDLAGRSNMGVFVGLFHDPAFWQRIDREATLVEVYLKRLQKNSLETARQLLPIVSKYPAFKGWYLCEEIDDKNWLEPSARSILAQHLSEEVSELKELSPDSVISVSGFSDGFADPTVFRTFWRQILESASLDLVFFQDGFGTARQDTTSLPLYLEALQAAVAPLETETQIIIELFEQKSQGDHAFRAVPAPLSRIEEQLEIVTQYSASAPIAFSVPDYMSPLAGPEAYELYKAFMLRFNLDGNRQ